MNPIRKKIKVGVAPQHPRALEPAKNSLTQAERDHGG